MEDRCNLCPRKCNAKRSSNKGYCKAPSDIMVSRAALHFWEEPCISGEGGSGTVFFSGCNMGCVFCQNTDIAHEVFGKKIKTGNMLPALLIPIIYELFTKLILPLF